jgi:hypothetical protein
MDAVLQALLLSGVSLDYTIKLWVLSKGIYPNPVDHGALENSTYATLFSVS